MNETTPNAAAATDMPGESLPAANAAIAIEESPAVVQAEAPAAEAEPLAAMLRTLEVTP